jgi:hypothetical protein
MGLLENFKNPFGEDIRRVSETQNELVKDVAKVIDTSHIINNSFLRQLYGKAENVTDENWAKEVSSVKSLVILEEGKKIQDLMRLVELTLRRRDKVLNEVIKLEWDKDKKEIWDSIINLRKRWQPERKIPDNLKMFISLVLNTYTQNRFIEEKNLDEQDLSKLANARYNFVKGEVSAFHNNYQNTLDNIKVYLEEIQEFKRFDELYLSNKNLLNKIPYITFYPSEIKALQAQETGDFTITSVAGLEQKNKGIKTGGRNLSFVGIGQIGADGLIDSVKWLSEKGIKIPLEPDPRTIPELAIKLTIGILGIYTEKYIYPHLPANKPEGYELKKIIFAAYNAGQGTVLKGINNYINATGKKSYTWYDVEPNVTALKKGQPKEYVENIIKRLTILILTLTVLLSCKNNNTSYDISSKSDTLKSSKKNVEQTLEIKKEIIFERILSTNKNIYLYHCNGSTNSIVSLYEPDFLREEIDKSIYSHLISYFKAYVDSIVIREKSAKQYKAYLINNTFIAAKRITKKDNYFIISGEIGDNPEKRTLLSFVLSLVVKCPEYPIKFEPSKPPRIELVQEIQGVVIGYFYEKDDPNKQRHLLYSRELPLTPYTQDGLQYSNELGIMKWKGNRYGELIELSKDGVPTENFLQNCYNLLH